MPNKPIRTADFNEIPLGLYLLEVYHERIGERVCHLSLKEREGLPGEQPQVPAWTEGQWMQYYGPFWTWAKKHLPIYEHPQAVRTAI